MKSVQAEAVLQPAKVPQEMPINAAVAINARSDPLRSIPGRPVVGEQG